MEILKQRILAEGKIKNESILKVDSFLNHQVDPVLMKEIGNEFANHYANQGITKVVTIESSGISPAIMTAAALNVPMVIMKKQPSKVLNDHLLQTEVVAFTKGTTYELTLAKEYIDENDHVLILDDFLADGEAVTGAIRLIRKTHATIAGIGVVIEKTFQPGRIKLEEQGFDVYALARIASLSDDKITFHED